MNDRNNNHARVVGEVAEEFAFSHEVYGERFYTTELISTRTSGASDRIVIMVSEKLLDVKAVWKGLMLSVWGRFKSYNKIADDGRKKLELFVFVTDVEVLEGTDDIPDREKNEVLLDGYLCKKPSFRITPFGREIVRLITSSDDSSYKNSIITFMKIDTKEWDRLLRNKNILYKRD